MSTSRPRVYTRIRPQNTNEVSQGGVECFSTERGHSDVLLMESKESKEQMKSRFDYVFDSSATQDKIFSHIGVEVMNTLFSGYNACVFAYGQTGSGKTHTMEGNSAIPDGKGLVPRFFDAIFEKFRSDDNITDAFVSMSLVQIYQEKIQDLFGGRKQLDIHLDRTGSYIAQGAAWVECRNPTDAYNVYVDGVKTRATSATEMNLVSSRSHMILMLKLQWDEPELPGSRAQLNLIDLAGSEKLYQSGATGEAMKEAIAINKSLSALGNVVSKLVDQVKKKGERVHVPYKDSKLTYLLQSSLGGSNLVHFILALSSSSLWKAESLATIEFGKRALQIVLRPVRNPIDYKRLEEMEAMIEKMRNRIRNLEEELTTNKNQAVTQPQFLAIKHLHQEDEGGREKHRRRRDKGNASSRAKLKTRTELSRIVANLPETLEDLTSHCVLFPASKQDFRQMDGLEKLVFFVDKSPSTFYRAHAAHTVAHVIDDEGREVFGNCGGVEALSRLLLVREERCKEAACVAIESVVRGCTANKKRLEPAVYEALTELISGYANQQVQEAALTALASIVDMFPEAKKELGPLGVVKKLLQTIREAPEEVAHVTKAAATCIGRLVHGDAQMQDEVARLGGIQLLIDNVLFSPVGERDHQVPILASYALVNLCCSSLNNMAIIKRHPRYDEVRFRLVEGLARVFGQNTVREQFGRATAQETTSPFPYYGVTIVDKWTPLTCGGRPIFSTFMENPQFYLYVSSQETKISLLIQDTEYETRMMLKQRNNTVYMGLAIFQGDAELSKAGLKQLDFHGKMVEIAKFTSNCENVLHCTLKASDTPYVVVPFTSQRAKSTTFALSCFADRAIELTKVPEMTGWVRTVVEGKWNALTAGTGDGFEWRNNSQVRVKVRENSRAVFVLSYLSLDQQRGARREEGAEDERQNNRPRLHGRVFSHNFVPDRRYVKALVPLPQHSTFVASNGFSSNSYITTAATLAGGSNYCYVPFTETPAEDTWRLCVYTDCDEVEVEPLQKEWPTHALAGNWNGEPLRLTVSAAPQSKMMVIATCKKETFLRISLFSPTLEKVGGYDAFWNGEGNVEHAALTPTTIVSIEGMVKTAAGNVSATAGSCDVFVFCTDDLSTVQAHFTVSPAATKIITAKTSPAAIEYAVQAVDKEEGDPLDGTMRGGAAGGGAFSADYASDGTDSDEDGSDSPVDTGGPSGATDRGLGRKSSRAGLGAAPAASEALAKAQAELEITKAANAKLEIENRKTVAQLMDRDQLIAKLKRQLEEGGGNGRASSGGAAGAAAAAEGGATGAVAGGSAAAFQYPNGARSLLARAQGQRSGSMGPASRQGVRPPGTPPDLSVRGQQDVGSRLMLLAAPEKVTAADWTRIRKELIELKARMSGGR